jgi:hypothetical protein
VGDSLLWSLALEPDKAENVQNASNFTTHSSPKLNAEANSVHDFEYERVDIRSVLGCLGGGRGDGLAAQHLSLHQISLKCVCNGSILLIYYTILIDYLQYLRGPGESNAWRKSTTRSPGK